MAKCVFEKDCLRLGFTKKETKCTKEKMFRCPHAPADYVLQEKRIRGKKRRSING